MKEAEVRKLHNRIAQLQHEEERALKRIEETREKANVMLENKIHQEQLARERYEQKELEMQKNREQVLILR